MKPDAHGEELASYISQRFEPLVRRWSHSVDGVFADAQDLVQDSVIALARNWPDVEDADRWMHRVCERGAAKVVRQRQHPVRGAVPLDSDYAASLPAEQDNPAADSDAYRLARELVTGPLEWKMLSLHAEGCTHAQIAEAVQDDPSWGHHRMRCTPANIGTMLRREKERLSREIRRRLAAQKDIFAANIKAVRREVLALPEKQRETFALRLLGLEPYGIAKVMGCKPGTARVNLSHANKRLGEALCTGASLAHQHIRESLSLVDLAVLLAEALPPLGTGVNSSPAALTVGDLASTTQAGEVFIGAYYMRYRLRPDSFGGKVRVVDPQVQRYLASRIFDLVHQDLEDPRMPFRIREYPEHMWAAVSAVAHHCAPEHPLAKKRSERSSATGVVLSPAAQRAG
jgi:DNA-directed RNA polymerase specialized sigma24 family protein